VSRLRAPLARRLVKIELVIKPATAKARDTIRLRPGVKKIAVL
jgi:hypothetical protein